MVKTSASIILGLLLLACQGAEMVPGGLKKAYTSKDAEASAEDESQSEPAPAAEPESVEEQSPTQIAPPQIAEDTAPPPPQAMSPVSIGGAYLTCKISPSDPSQAECLAKAESGGTLGVAMDKAFILSGSPVQWTKTSFTLVAADRYLVKLPEGVSSDVGIAMVYDTSKVAIDWLPTADRTGANLVQDASFEFESVYGQIAYFQQKSTHWLVTGDMSDCIDGKGGKLGVLELQTIDNQYVKTSPVHGRQWAELDADCPLNTLRSANARMGVYQYINFIPGHNYLIRFSYARRIEDGGSNQQRLQFSIDHKSIYEEDLTSGVWKQKTIFYKSSVNKVPFKFRDIGFGNGIGVLVDDAQVYDLGEDMQPI